MCAARNPFYLSRFVVFLICSWAVLVCEAPAETPYLLSDSNATPREISAAAILGKTMYALDRDIDGALCLFKMGDEESAFGKPVKIADGKLVRSYDLGVVGERLFIEIYYSSGASYLVSDGSSAVPITLPVDKSAQRKALLGNKVLLSEGVIDPRLIAVDLTSLEVEELLAVGHGNGVSVLGELPPRLVFTTDKSGGNGQELWITDGSSAGTTLLKDFSEGFVRNLGVAQGQLFFRHEGTELWRTDGSVAGTKLIIDFSNSNFPDLKPGLRLPEPDALATLGNGVAFLVTLVDSDTYENQCELWKTDGSANGTSLIKGLINPFYYAELEKIGERVVVAVSGYRGGSSLWSSDGSAAGTNRLLSSAGIMSLVGQSTNVGVFVVDSHSNSNGLYVTDGTIENTKYLKDFSYLSGETQVGSALFFSASDKGNTQPPWLWSSDGSVEGTAPVPSSINQSHIEDPRYFGKLNNATFWSARGSVIWQVVNGYTASQRGFNTILGDKRTKSGAIEPFAVHQGKFLLSGYPDWPRRYGSFVSTDEANSLEHFSTAIPSYPAYEWNRGSYGPLIISVGSQLYFFEGMSDGFNSFGFDTGFVGTFYRSDLTKAGTAPLGTFGLAGSDYVTAAVGKFGNRYLFSGKDSAGWGVFSTDGTISGMQKSELLPDLQTTFPVLNDFALVNVVGNSQREIWRTDGTPQGSRVTDLTRFSFDYYYSLNGVMHYLDLVSDDQGQSHVDLWRTDGSKAGSALVKTLSCNSLDGAVFAEYHSEMLILCGGSSVELWRSDGTDEGTVRLSQWSSKSSWESRIDVTSTHAYVTVLDSQSDNLELWVTDGSPSGTTLVRRWDFSWPNGIRYTKFIRGESATIGSTLYFTLWNESMDSYEIWKSNGTPDGTKLALAVPPGSFSWIGANLVSNGDTVVFTANDPLVGYEPWAFTTKDLNDQCPSDPRKLEPGVCGCGNPEMDSDSDGVVDCGDRGGDGGNQRTPTPTPTLTPVPTETPIPPAQPPARGQASPNIVGIAVSPPIIQQQGKSVVAYMQVVPGVTYKIAFTAKGPGASNKKLPIKIITSSKSRTILGSFKVGVTLTVSYKLVSGSQESPSSKPVRFNVKAVKKTRR